MPVKWQLYHEASILANNTDRKAINVYKNIIQRYGDTPSFYNGLAEFYFHLNEGYGRSAADAKPYLIKTIELDPANQEALWHLGNIAVMENDKEALQHTISLSNADNVNLLILEMILKDTVTDAEIEFVLSLTSQTTFFPVLYFASEEKPFHSDLNSRFVKLRPSENGERLANATRLLTEGREKEGYIAWKEIAKIDFTFGQITMDPLYRGVPAIIMTGEDFLPFSEHYELLYLDTKDRDKPMETYAAIKYALALNKKKDVVELKKKMQNLATTPKQVVWSKI